MSSDEDQATRRHPYAWRTRLRARLPWLLVELGFAGKGADCEAVGARHDWYNFDDRSSACYHCRIRREGQHWRR